MDKLNKKIMTPFEKALRDIDYPFLIPDEKKFQRNGRLLDIGRINSAFLEVARQFKENTGGTLGNLEYLGFVSGYDKALEDMGD